MMQIEMILTPWAMLLVGCRFVQQVGQEMALSKRVKLQGMEPRVARGVGEGKGNFADRREAGLQMMEKGQTEETKNEMSIRNVTNIPVSGNIMLFLEGLGYRYSFYLIDHSIYRSFYL